MRRLTFIDAQDLVVVPDGLVELGVRLLADDRELRTARAIAVRDELADWHLVVGRVERSRLVRELRAGVDPQRLDLRRLGIPPARTSRSRADPGDRTILLAGEEVRGAWVGRSPRRPLRRRARRRLSNEVLSAGIPEDLWFGATDGDESISVETFGMEVAAAGGSAPEERVRREPPKADPLLRRTPHLEAPAPLPAQPGARFDVRVWTDTAPTRLGEEAEDVVIEAPPEVTHVELGVLLIASPHLEVDGAYFQPLTIERERADSEPVSFAMRVADRDAAGDPELVAQFLFRGRPCGRVRRRWAWPDGSPLAVEDAPAGIPVHTDATAPDMTVLITATDDGRAYTCVVQAPGVPGFELTRPEAWGQAAEADALIARRLERLLDRTASSGARRIALKAAGRAFWNAAPPSFQRALWALIDQRAAAGAEGRAAIYVASDEPLLPWEIMLPSRSRQGLPDEDRRLPLGAEFALGRWVRRDATSPPPVLAIRDSALIAPSYPLAQDEPALDPTAEWNVLQRHFGGRRLEPASYDELDRQLRERAASLLHFVCHGAVEDDDALLYLDHWAPCTSAELRESEGFKAACGERLPIVFLNACDAGHASPGLGPGGSGFPRAFSELGARAVIAPLWPVTVANAPHVARELYERALAEPERPLADVLADLRERSYAQEPFDDTWAAYCLFGDPRARLRLDAG